LHLCAIVRALTEVPVPVAPTLWQQMRSRLGPTVATLMVGLLAIHVTFLVAVGWLHSEVAASVYERWLALSWPAVLSGWVWTVATYALLHDLGDFTHIAFNLLALFFFGPALERQWGGRAFVRFFAVSVVLGGVLQLLGDLVTGHADVTVGASAGMMGLLAAFAWSNPDARVLLFFVVPVRARFLVPIVLGIDFLSYLSGSHIAFFAHLGGVLGAWVSVKRLTNPRIAKAWARGVGTWVSRKLGRRRNIGLAPRDPGDRSGWN
jgi:membrane associated rhomboid family serine protease